MSEIELFEYGIQIEQSDIRAHVSVVNKSVYVFKTREGIHAIEKHKPPMRAAFQAGVNGPTARGWVLDIRHVRGLRPVRWPSWPRWDEFREDMKTSEKGKLAVECVIALMRIGYFPLWIDTAEDERENIQINGTDIVLFCRKKIQVKCDWRSGDKPLGTGNLFLQYAERNPLKRH